MVCSPKTSPAGLLVSWNAKERRAEHEEVPVLAGADRLRLAAGGDWLSTPTAFGRYTTLVTRQSGEPSSTVPKPLRDLTDRNRPSFTSAIAFVGDEPAEFWSLIATYDWYLVTRLLFGGLDRLPSNQREVLELRFFEGQSFPEIAREMEVSTDEAARSRCRRAWTRPWRRRSSG